jgi:PAS domain S-box-containing protein
MLCVVIAVFAAVAGFVGGAFWMRRRDGQERSIGRAARLIVEGMPAQGWSTDPDGNFTYLNPVLIDFYGLGADFFLLDKDRMADFASAFRNRQKTVLHPDDLERTAEAWRRCRESGTHFTNEHRVLRADGVYRWIRAAANPARDASGKIVAWYGTSVDIDDLKKTELALKQREQALQRLIDTVPVHIWCAEPDGEPTYMNGRLRAYLGLTLEDFGESEGSRLAQVVPAIVHPDDAAAVEREVRRAAATGTSFNMEYRQRRADGVYRWIEGRSEPLFDEDGTVIQRYGICIDIDDRKRADEALRQREQELRRIVDAVPAQVWSIMPDGQTRYINCRLRQHAGIRSHLTEAEEPVPFTDVLRSILHPEDQEEAERALAASLATGTPFAARYRLRRSDGRYQWTEGRAEPLRDPDGQIVQWYGICLDIDDLVRAEVALRENERRLQQIVDTVPAQIWCVSPDGEATYFSRRLREYIGLSLDTFDRPGASRFAVSNRILLHPEDHPAVEAALLQSLRTGKPFSMRYRLRRHDGVYRWTDGRMEALLGPDGEIVQWYGICLDVDELTRVEEALRRSEREFRSLVDTIPAMIFAVPSPDGPLHMNKTYTDYTGYAVENYLAPGGTNPARVLDELIHPHDRERVARNYFHHFQLGQPLSHRYRLRRADGVFRWVEGRCASLHDETGNPVGRYGILIDVDDEVSSQRALRRSQDRLTRATQAASLAELSASIAHEVNQPLAAVVANAQACQRWLVGDTPNVERARLTTERVIRDAHAAAEVVGRIRALFRQSTEARTTADINTVLDEACALMAENAVAAGVELITDFGDVLPAIDIDRIQIQQALINLIRNGIEAMEEERSGGAVTVRSRRENDELLVEVCDEGPGIEDLERIFDPFFTTKPGGMGMGLAICRSIVEAHSGRLSAARGEPQGTIFRIELPLKTSAAVS